MASYGYLLPTRGAVLSSDDPATLAAKAEADVLGLSKRAEALGFGSVWVGDSVVAKPRFEPLSTLAAVGAATDAVELGTAVYLPNLRHAVNVAHLSATVDQLSGGRLKLGVGVGIGSDVEAEHDVLGLDFETRGAMLDETLDVLSRLWTGEAIDYDGEFYGFEGGRIGFQPSRSPPIYVASAAFDPSEGFPRRIGERLATHGDGWLPIGLDPDTYAAGLSRIREIASDAGRDPGTIDPAYYIDLVIDESEEAAIEEARAFLRAYYPAWGELSDDDIRARGAFGPAEAVADTLADFREAGVETTVVRFTAGNQREQLARFASAVDDL